MRLKYLSMLCINMGLLSATAHGAAEPKIEFLAPPILTQETISERIVCTRPMREGCFNISTETFQGNNGTKLIVNNYGHGGSGWTTLFGSVDNTIEKLVKEGVSKDQPIRVIGSGCMGLTTAIELKRLGYNVAGITTKDLYDLPSWRAAGYFAIVSVKTSPEEEANLKKIGNHTFLTYQQIDKGLHPYIGKDAVRYMPVYCSVDTHAGVEDLEAEGLIPAKEFVTLDFGNGKQQPGYVKYMTYFMNTTILMRQLTAEVQRLGIPVTMQTISSFDDISESVVFNCTGLGGKELNHDDKMIPVRGHLIALNEKAGTGHMEYMIYTYVEQDGREECVYLFPKTVSVTPENPQGTECRSIIGGSFIPNVDYMTLEEQEALNQLEFRRLLDRNSQFYTGKPFSAE